MNPALDSDQAIWALVDLDLQRAKVEEFGDDLEGLELQRRAVHLRTKSTERPPARKGSRK